MREILLDSPLENGSFLPDFVESEKKNLISTIESDRNDKRVYAIQRLLRTMCARDSFGIPRLGEIEDVAAITPEGLTEHYREILRTSPMELLYVGSAAKEQVISTIRPLLDALERAPVTLPPQTVFTPGQVQDITETLDVAQGKLCMGFSTPVTNRCKELPAMQMFNVIFGGGMTSKLFQNVREKMSLCYSIDASYYGAKGILLVNAGIDFDKETVTRQEILKQLDACRKGEITEGEMTAARQALLSSLRSVPDSPGSIENFTSTPGIPRSSPVFKPRSLERTSRVKPGDFTFNLRWPPARPLRPVIPNNAYTPRIAAAAGTELAGVFFKGTITCHAYSTSHHFSP